MYSFVLEGTPGLVRPSGLLINGMECIALAHGIEANEVAAHAYFGTERVVADLATKFSQRWENGLVELDGSTQVLQEPRDESGGCRGRISGLDNHCHG